VSSGFIRNHGGTCGAQSLVSFVSGDGVRHVLISGELGGSGGLVVVGLVSVFRVTDGAEKEGLLVAEAAPHGFRGPIGLVEHVRTKHERTGELQRTDNECLTVRVKREGASDAQHIRVELLGRLTKRFPRLLVETHSCVGTVAQDVTGKRSESFPVDALAEVGRLLLWGRPATLFLGGRRCGGWRNLHQSGPDGVGGDRLGVALRFTIVAEDFVHTDESCECGLDDDRRSADR